MTFFFEFIMDKVIVAKPLQQHKKWLKNVHSLISFGICPQISDSPYGTGQARS